VQQEVKNIKKEVADSYSYVNLVDGRDGWKTIRLRKKDFTFRGKGDYKQDWSKVKSVSFGFGRGMQGKMMVYFDNIRFEKSKNNDPNIILNSSFEQETSPGTPDCWHRDLNAPPFGKNIWGLDYKNSFSGKKSLRIGFKGKYLSPGGSTIRIIKGKTYTLSFYSKSDQNDTTVSVTTSGIKLNAKKKIFKISKEWKRYIVSGKATGIKGSFSIKLLSDKAAVWIDAVQLVEDDKALPYTEPRIADSGKPEIIKEVNSSGKSIILKEASVKPVVDGKLNDSCWQKAVAMKDFTELKDKSLSADKTVAKITFDDEAFYIGVEAEEKDMARVKKALESSQKGPWGTDLIEVFIDFNNDNKSYYQFVANVKGQKYLSAYKSMRKRKNWDCKWSAAGKLYKDKWTLEIKIPYSSLDLSKIPVREMGINICRTSMSKPNRNSAWSFPSGSFHNISKFGKVKGFKPEKLKSFMFDIASLSWKYGKAGATFKNNSGRDVNLGIKFTALASDGRKISSKSSNVSIKSDKTANVVLPLPLKNDGLYRLSVAAVDDKGILRVASQNKAIKISGASLFKFYGSEYDFYTRDKVAKVRCLIDADAKKCKTLKLNWQLSLNNKTVLNDKNMSVKSGFNYWELPLNKLKNGNYQLMIELVENAKVIVSDKSTFKKLAPAKQEVRINRWGRFLVQNGKPFLMYGFYDHTMGQGKLKSWEAVLDDTKKAHCNAHMVYMGNNPVVHKDAGRYLDAAAERGQKIWVHLSGMFAWHIKKYAKRKSRYFSEAEAMKGLREVVLKYKDHPALIGWCTLDEPGNRPHIFTKEIVKKYYDEVKKLDPHHPCALSHITHLGESKIYGESTDLAFIPFLPRGGRYDYLFQELWNIGKPIITNSPSYGGVGNRKHEPTPSEQRIAMYKGLILGARGICTYTYRPNGPGIWNEFIQIGKELEYLSPALLTSDDKLRFEISTEGQNIFAVLKKYKKKYYLIAVNTAPFEIDVKFTLSSIVKIINVKNLFKTKKGNIDRNLKTIKLKMNKQSTAIFEIN
jgi:cellulose/xylan binding protein with CBM9 domain